MSPVQTLLQRMTGVKLNIVRSSWIFPRGLKLYLAIQLDNIHRDSRNMPQCKDYRLHWAKG